jgi:AraC family transcriptional activator of pobA
MNKQNENVPMHSIKTKEMRPLGFDVIDLMGKGGRIYDSSVPHRHTFFELLFFTGGKGIHEIDFDRFPVEKNSVHFVSPGQIHKLLLNKTDGYVVCFTEDFISLKANESFVESFPFYDSSNHPVLKLSNELASEIDDLITSVVRELKLTHTENLMLLSSYLNIILLKLRTHFLSGHTPAKQLIAHKKQKVVQFKKLINEAYLQHKTTSDYAKELNVSTNHLNALCKKYEGKTATQLIQERLLLEAKRLLYATDMNIKEISFSLKFEDVPYFNRFFKKHTSLTPIEYRTQILEKSLKSTSS